MHATTFINERRFEGFAQQPEQTIAAHVVDDLRRKGLPTSEEDRAQFIALLIATEFPDADEMTVKLAITPEALTEAITGSWLVDQDEGKRISLSHKWPLWKALAIHWFRNTKKTKPAPAGRAA